MKVVEDPFQSLAMNAAGDEASVVIRKPVMLASSTSQAMNAALVGSLHGFDLDERPLVSSLETLPGEIIAARTTVSLLREMIGASVLILNEAGDPHLPIIVGILQSPGLPYGRERERETSRDLSVHADGERHVIRAEREIVLCCGDASITLTRAGKVIIKGNYILSRSTGYNKIKGAAIDIN